MSFECKVEKYLSLSYDAYNSAHRPELQPSNMPKLVDFTPLGGEGTLDPAAPTVDLDLVSKNVQNILFIIILQTYSRNE